MPTSPWLPADIPAPAGKQPASHALPSHNTGGCYTPGKCRKGSSPAPGQRLWEPAPHPSPGSRAPALPLPAAQPAPGAGLGPWHGRSGGENLCLGCRGCEAAGCSLGHLPRASSRGDGGVGAALAPPLSAARGCVSTEYGAAGGETRAAHPVVNSCLHNSRPRCEGCECVAGWAIPCLPPAPVPSHGTQGSPPGAAMPAWHGWAELPRVPQPDPWQGAAGETQLVVGTGRYQRDSWVSGCPWGISRVPSPWGELDSVVGTQFGSNRASQGSSSRARL